MTQEVLIKIRDLLLELDWDVDNEGQVIIYTGCRYVGNVLTPLEGDGDGT